MNKKRTILSTLLLSVSLGALSTFNVVANNVEILSEQNTVIEGVIENKAPTIFKKELIEKLSRIEHFSATFEQEVIDNSGNVLQRGGGDLSVKRPNLVHWNTTSPDESLIVSDGESIFLYDPFIEQVTAYKLDGAIANTPILLITTNDEALWEQYSVSRTAINHYVIHANDANSRIKTLEITFNEESELKGFTFLDVTGQLSKVLLSDVDIVSALPSSIFSFVIPEGTHLDDQR